MTKNMTARLGAYRAASREIKPLILKARAAFRAGNRAEMTKHLKAVVAVLNSAQTQTAPRLTFDQMASAFYAEEDRKRTASAPAPQKPKTIGDIVRSLGPDYSRED